MRLPLTLVLLAACGGAAKGTDGGTDGGAPEAGAIQDSGPAAPEAPLPAVLASGFVAPFGIALIGSTLYVADTAAGTVSAVPAAGGNPVVVASNVPSPTWLATDGQQLFAVDAADGAVLAVTLAGGVTTLVGGLGAPGRIAAAGGTVFVLDQGPGGDGGALHAIPAAGGADVKLATGLALPTDFAIGPSRIFYAEEVLAPDCNSLDNTDSARISSVPLAGGTPTLVWQAAQWEDGFPVGLAADAAGENLYLTQGQLCSGAGAVAEVPVATGKLSVLCDAPPGSSRIQTTAADAIWASSQNLSQVPLDGGPYQDIAVQTAVGDFVVGPDGTIYWTDQLAGEVLSLGG